ncbi:MAG TPA: lipid kinase, partial [Anaeromyxobacteraceae bacterium]|nr:lipid kinase [Anaeromyxobacteraceae bacterium]
RRLAGGELKKRAGPLAYPAAAAAEAAAHQPFLLRLDADGERAELPALQVVIGNGRFHGGGRLVAPHAKVDDRRLEVYVVVAEAAPDASEGVDRFRDLVSLARYAVLLMRGRHLEHPRIVHRHAARVSVETDPPMPINADGEDVGVTPAVFELLPARLRVTVPG